MAVWAIGGDGGATYTSKNGSNAGTGGGDDGASGVGSGIGTGGAGYTSYSGVGKASGTGDISSSSSSPASSSWQPLALVLVHVFRVHDLGVNCVAANAGVPLNPTLP